VRAVFCGRSTVAFYSGASFRPSVAKKPQEVQFFAINCHVHDVIVREADQANHPGTLRTA